MNQIMWKLRDRENINQVKQQFGIRDSSSFRFSPGIELLCPCMDDYLYLYDFKKDYYYISSHALDRYK